MIVHEVVGIERQSGSFQGNTYDNLKFQCLICPDEKNSSERLEGRKVEVVKMKAKDFDGGLEVGDCAVFYFDKYQTAVDYKKM